MATVKFVASEWENVTARLFSLLRHSSCAGEFTETVLRSNPEARRELVRLFPGAKVGTATGKRAGSCRVRLTFMEEATGKRHGSGTLADMVSLLNGEKDWACPKVVYTRYFLSPVGQYNFEYLVQSREKQASVWLESYGTNVAHTLMYAVALEMVKAAVKGGKLRHCTATRWSDEYTAWCYECRDFCDTLAQEFCGNLSRALWSDYVI